MTQLEIIREQIKSKNDPLSGNGTPPCPKCNKPLTVEKTDFFHTELCEHCLEHSRIIDTGKCCKNPELHAVRLITSSGVSQVRNQCKACGNVSPVSIGGFSKEQREGLPVVDEQAREDRNVFIQTLYAAFWKKKHDLRNKQYLEDREQKRQQWLKEYNNYLQSAEWKEKRDAVLKRDKYLCQCCLGAYATQVHHKSYQFVDLTGSEPCFDLVAICTPCHKKIEEMKKQQQ